MIINTEIIIISSNQVKGISHRMADKYITRLSNFIERYKEIRYITNKSNNNCVFVKGSTNLMRLITIVSLPSVTDKDTSNYNDNNSWDNPDM